MSHTPTPWYTTKKFEITTISKENDMSRGMMIPHADVFGDNREEDAAFIVQACNAHEELVAALKDLLNLDERCGWHSKQADVAKAALAKVGAL